MSSVLLCVEDGLWNYVEADEVAVVISQCLRAQREHCLQQSRGEHQTPPPSTPAQCLLTKCQQNAASSAGISLEALLALPTGTTKRDILDDITIIVLFAATATLD
jgi:hypothetical protein